MLDLETFQPGTLWFRKTEDPYAFGELYIFLEIYEADDSDEYFGAKFRVRYYDFRFGKSYSDVIFLSDFKHWAEFKPEQLNE